MHTRTPNLRLSWVGGTVHPDHAPGGSSPIIGRTETVVRCSEPNPPHHPETDPNSAFGAFLIRTTMWSIPGRAARDLRALCPGWPGDDFPRSLVICVSYDSTCWSSLDPPVFRGSRCGRVLTPLADDYTGLFLAAAESAVCRSVSRWSARRRSLWPNDLYTRRRTATIAAPRKGPARKQRSQISPTKRILLINNWIRN